MSELLDALRDEFSDEEARYAYVEAHLNASIAAQLKTLREEYPMTQEQLAEKLGTKQSGISRLQNANYSSWKIDTLRRLARALGVRLKIGLEEFGTLIPEIENFNKRNLSRRKFEDDPVFNPGTEVSKVEDALVAGQRVNGIAELANASADATASGEGWRGRLDLAADIMNPDSELSRILKRLAGAGPQVDSGNMGKDQPVAVDDSKSRSSRSNVLPFDRRRRNRGRRSRGIGTKRRYGT